MSKFIGYRCSLCGQDYLPGEVTYTCPKDGGNLDVVLDYDAIRNKYQPEDIVSRADPSLWRYLPLLPVPEVDGGPSPLHVAGGTPVFDLSRLGQKLGLKRLWLKDESLEDSANLPAPGVIAAEIMEDLEAALEQFREIAMNLGWGSGKNSLLEISQCLETDG